MSETGKGMITDDSGKSFLASRLAAWWTELHTAFAELVNRSSTGSVGKKASQARTRRLAEKS